MAYNPLIATKLRLPFAGHRNRGIGDYAYEGTTAYYWSSTHYSFSAYDLAFNTSSGIYPANNFTRGYAFSLRCLKN